MNELINLIQRYSRRILAVGIILISLTAAAGLVSQADKSVSMWGARNSLVAGQKIKVGDLEILKVSLGSQAPKYFSNKARLVGNFLTKAITQGELIPVSGVSKNGLGVSQKEIPIGIAKNDLPSTIRVGDIVDLYSIPIKDAQAKSSLVVSKIQVGAIDTRTQNMGGSIDVLFNVNPADILQITDAVQAGRIVVVRNAL